MPAPQVDPDVDLHVAGQRREWSRHRFVLPAIALGGVAGASARYAAGRAWPTPEHAFPWTTLGVNALGCLLIGVLMVFVVEVGGAHPLLRPFAGVGVLGRVHDVLDVRGRHGDARRRRPTRAGAGLLVGHPAGGRWRRWCSG